MDSNGLRLADPVYAVIALIFDRRVPPPAQVNDMVGGNDVEADAGGFRRQQKHPEAVDRFCKRVNDRQTFFAWRPAVDYRRLPVEIEQGSNSVRDGVLHR